MTMYKDHAILDKKKNDFVSREAQIIERIKKHYSDKLKRKVDDTEAREIAYNLLNFAKVIYGIEK